MNDYDAIIWILGQENNGSSFDANERAAVRAYLDQGGSLFVSGSEVAADLNERDGQFLSGVLQTQFGGNDSQTYVAEGKDGSIFQGLRAIRFDDGTGSMYKVQTPDILRPAADAEAALVYTGTNAPAAVQYAGNGYKLVYIGFPFETIENERTRTDIMERALRFLLQSASETAQAN
jgi:hypothetical protein